jgi:TonB family protein
MSGLLRSQYESQGTGQTWKRWEGRTVAGRFPLKTCLGGTDHHAVFLTSMPGAAGSKEAVIRLSSADGVEGQKQLLQWQAAAELSHPNLIRIYEAGRSELDGVELIYAVEEYAEENLAQILPDRALTPEEAREMLAPVLRAVQFLHDKGLVHGRIQPSNILASGDQVKLASDTVSLPRAIDRDERVASIYHPPESAMGAVLAPADVWQLGVTLVEALTQRLPRFDLNQNRLAALPDGIPQPLREIVENCLRTDPTKRWTVTQIADRLQGRQPEAALGPVAVPAITGAALPAPTSAASGRGSAKWLYAMPFIMAIAIVIFLIARPKTPRSGLGSAGEAQSKQAQPVVAPEHAQSARTSTQAEPKPNPTSSGGASGDTKIGGAATTTTSGAEAGLGTPDENGVVHRVLPQVSAGALRTVRGTIKVRARVTVDSAGNVTKARIESGGPSKYFSRIALEAARDWKFAPAQAGESGDREWNLQFDFNRKKTDASSVRGKR